MVGYRLKSSKFINSCKRINFLKSSLLFSALLVVFFQNIQNEKKDLATEALDIILQNKNQRTPSNNTDLSKEFIVGNWKGSALYGNTKIPINSSPETVFLENISWFQITLGINSTYQRIKIFYFFFANNSPG